MAYSTVDARQRLLDGVGTAIEALGIALGALGSAYELLDDHNGERLEEELFGPVQGAYGRTKRIYGEFATRHDLPVRAFPPPPPGAPSRGAEAFISVAVNATSTADAALGELQDSMLPIEVGDEELRATLAGVRTTIGEVPGRARALTRQLGR